MFLKSNTCVSVNIAASLLLFLYFCLHLFLQCLLLHFCLLVYYSFNGILLVYFYLLVYHVNKFIVFVCVAVIYNLYDVNGNHYFIFVTIYSQAIKFTRKSLTFPVIYHQVHHQLKPLKAKGFKCIHHSIIFFFCHS